MHCEIKKKHPKKWKSTPILYTPCGCLSDPPLSFQKLLRKYGTECTLCSLYMSMCIKTCPGDRIPLIGWLRLYCVTAWYPKIMTIRQTLETVETWNG